MVRVCCVARCTISEKNSKLKMYRIPSIKDHNLQIQAFHEDSIDLLLKRRKAWLDAVGMEETTKQLYVCSNHFVTGKKSNLHSVNDPDWVPSLNLDVHKDNDLLSIINARQRKPKTTKNQYSVYVCFMQENQEWRNQIILNERYIELTEKLNTVDDGPKRTAKEWRKVFNDWKAVLYNKARFNYNKLNAIEHEAVILFRKIDKIRKCDDDDDACKYNVIENRNFLPNPSDTCNDNLIQITKQEQISDLSCDEFDNEAQISVENDDSTIDTKEMLNFIEVDDNFSGNEDNLINDDQDHDIDDVIDEDTQNKMDDRIIYKKLKLQISQLKVLKRIATQAEIIASSKGDLDLKRRKIEAMEQQILTNSQLAASFDRLATSIEQQTASNTRLATLIERLIVPNENFIASNERIEVKLDTVLQYICRND